jgi:hypothetical protein
MHAAEQEHIRQLVRAHAFDSYDPDDLFQEL